MSEQDLPRVSVVIVNYNAGTLLARCVACLKVQTVENFEAIIVDNASTDNSLQLAAIDDPRFTVMQLKANLGFSAANNQAFALARAPWIATLNPDAFPMADWLEKLMDATERHSNVHCFGSTQIKATDPTRLDGAGDCYHILGIPWRGGFGHSVRALPAEGEVFSPCAAAALYSAAALRNVGGFDDSFFCYCEDVDLGFRLRLAGGRCIQVAGAVVYHYGSAISGHDSPFTLFHSARNRLWTFIKNMPGPLLIVLMPFHLAATFYLLFRVRHAKGFRPQWDGLIAGLRGLGPVLRRRKQVQAERSLAWWGIVGAFTWSLDALRQRRPDVRPLTRTD